MSPDEVVDAIESAGFDAEPFEIGQESFVSFAPVHGPIKAVCDIIANVGKRDEVLDVLRGAAVHVGRRTLVWFPRVPWVAAKVTRYEF